MSHLVGGVVHQDVDPAEFLDSSRDDVTAMLRIGYVASDEDGPAAGILDEPGGLLRVVVLLQIGDQDIAALPARRPDPT